MIFTGLAEMAFLDNVSVQAFPVEQRFFMMRRHLKRGEFIYDDFSVRGKEAKKNQ